MNSRLNCFETVKIWPKAHKMSAEGIFSTAFYNKIIQNDLKLLWIIQDWVYHRPWLDVRMASIVSKHPWQDICMIIWLFAALGVYDIGARHFWIIATNLSFAFIARKVIRAKRPVEYDVRLQAMTDLNEDSFGFPSLESHMAVVIMLHFTMNTSWFMLPLALLIIFIVGFSRVYSRSRFPHQIVGSWLLGLVGLYLGSHCCERMKFHTMSHHEHITCITIAVVFLLINFGLAIESNQSRLFYVPRQEFIKVMVGIINGSTEKSDGRAEVEDMNFQSDDGQFSESKEGPSASSVPSTPRSAMLRQMKAGQQPKRYTNGQRPKRDSFYFLQKSLEDREKKQKSSQDLYTSVHRPRYEDIDDDHEHVA